MTYIGQSVRRFEDHRLLTGQGPFVDDMKLQGLLHALVLRSPQAHAGIRSIDVGTASRLPGVVELAPPYLATRRRDWELFSSQDEQFELKHHFYKY